MSSVVASRPYFLNVLLELQSVENWELRRLDHLQSPYKSDKHAYMFSEKQIKEVCL